ncbi:hypothetical protein BDF20DRAFT_635653 [Mycotypha africana]|uniref:uncharacterized protein n=1 Tax=Mycotypha africana TaxID=64632 RepID=UPI0023000937|nr:uncharacterized protein BDF20DRAFT_635653 [Mycotypha africana]KAI8973245.1 hypothetical protein BDF20DRAFT_635653 [Mycotypha africana]
MGFFNATTRTDTNMSEEKGINSLTLNTWHHPPPISAIQNGQKGTLEDEEKEKEEDFYSTLPTLDDVLHRRTRPPICLYNYYIILRDRLKMDHVLDFWLDVSQAHILHKKYLKYRNKVNQQQQQQTITDNSAMSAATATPTTAISTIAAETADPRPSLATTALTTMSGSYDSLYNSSMSQNRMDKLTPGATTKPHKKRVPPPTHTDLLNILDRIYLKYIAPSAEKEITQLPSQIKQAIKNKMENFANISRTAIEGDSDEVLITLDIFDEAQNYLYHQILLKLTYPLFIKYKVKMNLTLPQQIGRFVVGLMSLWIGFSMEFSLIFLNIQPWHKRLWGLLPISLGVFCMVSSVTGVDPLWVLLFNISETVPFHFNSILQYQVKKILVKRAWAIFSAILFIIFLFMLFFCSVAGKRL